MDWVIGIQRAIDYVETHITEELDYDEIARAFTRFHGITPSQARREGATLNSFSRLSLKLSLEGGCRMEYRVEEKPKMVLTGYRRWFTGVPHITEEYKTQTENFYMHTRVNQILLRYMSTDNSQTTDYNVIDHVTDDGYDFYIAAELTEWFHTHMAEDTVLGEEASRFEDIVIPAGTYAVFETEHCKYPTQVYVELRKRIASEWLPSSGYLLADRPEIVTTYWYRDPEKENRYMELWVPVEKRTN